MWYDEKINKKIFLGGCFGAPNPFYFTILEGFWGPQNTPQKYFFLSYHIVWTLSFPGIPYFLFYNDFKRFYETLKKIGKNLGILYSKICLKIGFLEVPRGTWCRRARALKTFLVVSIMIWNQKSNRATLKSQKVYFWDTLMCTLDSFKTLVQ